jgi:hypothetical protein
LPATTTVVALAVVSNRVAGTAAVALLLYAVFVHLDRFPRMFFDEGAYLKVAKNLAAEGLYAESGSDGPLYYGATVAIGGAGVG